MTSLTIFYFFVFGRFHVAVHPFSIRSQKTLECSKNIIDKLRFFFLTHILKSSVINYSGTDARQNRIYLLICYQIDTMFFFLSH